MSNDCSNACKLSPMDSISNIEAIGIHVKRKGKTTKVVKPLPTLIKEKETHWPEEP